MPKSKSKKRTEKKAKLDAGLDHSQIAYKGLRRLLYHKELVPGQKVSCRAVAEKLEMSLTPVIQALKMMEYQGFVYHKPNRGYYMTPMSIQEVKEIYQLRYLVEPALIPETIKKMTEEGLSALKTALEAHRSTEKEVFVQDRLFKNADFHLTLASLSEMETHIRLLRQIYNLLFVKYGGNYLPVAYTRSVDEEHQKVFDAVKAGETEKAQEALAQHIGNVKSQVMSMARNMLEKVDVPEF